MRQKEPKTDGYALKNRMAEAYGMPKDVVLGVPVLTVTGRMEFILANYRGILEYTDVLIVCLICEMLESKSSVVISPLPYWAVMS